LSGTDRPCNLQALLFTGIVDSIVGGIALLAYLAVLANTLMTRRQFRLTIAGKVW
jgi:hypothetical protein